MVTNQMRLRGLMRHHSLNSGSVALYLDISVNTVNSWLTQSHLVGARKVSDSTLKHLRHYPNKPALVEFCNVTGKVVKHGDNKKC